DRTKGGIAETHEGLIETTPPREAYGKATQIEAERDSHAARNLVEQGDNDTRLGDTGAEAEGRAPGSAQPSGHADATGAVGRETEAAVRSGTIGEGGNQTAPESDRVRKVSERVNKAPTPLLNFLSAQGGIRATDELISDLRQALGA